MGKRSELRGRDSQVVREDPSLPPVHLPALLEAEECAAEADGWGGGREWDRAEGTGGKTHTHTHTYMYTIHMCTHEDNCIMHSMF